MLDAFINQVVPQIDEINRTFLRSLDLAPKLKEAMLYSYNAGGKRIRPVLLLAVIEGFGADISKGLRTAACLELIHTSSLIHDDLPAMDNDDYRRGLPTNHKVFGEATAILAGDSLLVDAYRLIATDELLTPTDRVRLISELSTCSGANGMIGGQELDIENENTEIDLDTLVKINKHKTGKLIEFALVAGAIIANQNEVIIEKMRRIGEHIGIAFQIKDDILDVEGDKAILGKNTLRDEKNHKTTYVKLIGLEGAKHSCQVHYEKALTLLRSLGMNTAVLEALFRLIIDRNK